MIHTGDCLDVLRTMHDESVHCCVTSPPYFGLRDYGVDGQIGLEPNPEAFVSRLVEVFREVLRVLRKDGTLWLNLGDSYASGGSGGSSPKSTLQGYTGNHVRQAVMNRSPVVRHGAAKQLLGIPWRVAFALQADGWYLRQDIIWHKPNPMPESVKDRCTKAHEYLFLLSKSERYHFDAGAIKEPASTAPHRRGGVAGLAACAGPMSRPTSDGVQCGQYAPEEQNRLWGADGTRNRRSVWTVGTRPYKGAHFATFPPKLIEPCILAGCPAGGVVLDPFFGAGTTGMVAMQHGRGYVGIELNPEYVEIAQQRIAAAANGGTG